MKILQKGGGQAGSRGGCLKMGGGWNPLANYGLDDTLNFLSIFGFAENMLFTLHMKVSTVE